MNAKINKDNFGYLFILPFFIVFLLFNLYPILYSLYLSFMKWDGFTEPVFVGLDNYIRLIKDTYFFKSIINTFIIWIISVIPQLLLALTLAIILNEKFIRGKHFFRQVYYFPNIVTPVTLGVMFALMFDWQAGGVNKLLLNLGLVDDPINWFGSPILSQIIIASLLCWQWFGYNMLLYIAGLQSIPESLYEAAYMDGATKRQIAFNILIPLLKPMIVFTIITSVIGGLQIFDAPLIMGRGPEDSTLTMIMYLYEMSFVKFDYGYGSAIAYGVFMIIVVFSILSVKLSKLNK